MNWTTLALCAAFLAGASGFAAEQAQIKAGESHTLEFAKDKLFLRNGENQRRLLIGKVLYIWSPPAATPASAEVAEDGTMKIEYTVNADNDPKKTPEQNAQMKADAKEIKLSAVASAKEGRVKIVYTLVSPKVKPDGAMFELLPQGGAKKGEKYNATVWKPRPFGGKLVAAKGGEFRAFSDKAETVWLKLPGNAGWTNGWAEHAGFRKSGDGQYTSTLEFIITPAGFSGEDAAAIDRNDPVSLSFGADGLLIRNLTAKAIENAELILNGKAETVTVAPGEAKKIAVEPGDAPASAILKVGEQSFAAQETPKKK